MVFWTDLVSPPYLGGAFRLYLLYALSWKCAAPLGRGLSEPKEGLFYLLYYIRPQIL